MSDVANNDLLLERWIIRHRVADPLSRWQEADASKAPPLAFTIIASDPRAFLRLGDAAAAKIARQAIEVIQHLQSVSATTPETVVAIRAVQSRILAWQRQVASRKTREHSTATDVPKGVIAAAKQHTLAEKLKLAIAEFPHYSPMIAPALSDYALNKGADGLCRLPSPADTVIAMATARLAAKRWRAIAMAGESYTGQGSKAECIKAIAIVQEWAAATGQNPLIADHDVKVEAAPDRAASFAADAATCVEIAMALPGGVGDPAFSLWEDAEEFHAYGAVGLKRGYLQMMDFDRAQATASAAARLAEAAIADPGLRLPEMPELVGPRTVLATARSALSGGVLSRRSDLQSMAFAA